jgi:hypothetical protein
MPKVKTPPKSKETSIKKNETKSKPFFPSFEIAKLGSLGALGVMGLTMLNLIYTHNPGLFKKLISYLWSTSTGFVTGGYTTLVMNTLTALGIFDLLEDVTGQIIPKQQREMIIQAWMNIIAMFGYNVKYKGDPLGQEAISQIDLLNNGLGEIKMGMDPPAETVSPVSYSPLVTNLLPSKDISQRLDSLITNSSSTSMSQLSGQESPTSNYIISPGDWFAGFFENMKLTNKRKAFDELERESKKIALQ